MSRPRKAETTPKGIVARTLKSGRVVYYVAYQTAAGTQKQERSGFDLREAKALRAKRAREVKEGTYTPAVGARGRVTLASFAPIWIGWLKTSGKRAWSTQEAIMRDHVVPRLGSRAITDIRPADVMDFIAELRNESGRAPKTIANIHGALSACLQYAKVRELVTTNVAKGLPRGVLPGKRPVRKLGAWTLDEVYGFLFDERNREDRRVTYAIAAFTGARLGEVAGMRWRDLDTLAPDLWRWVLKTQYDGEPLKTDNPRDIPIHPVLRELLEKWRAVGAPRFLCRKPTDDDFVVPREDGRCNSKESIGSKDVRRRAEKIGIEVGGRDFHSFRRFFITQARTDHVRYDVVERITHNGRGEMVDGYTYFEWPTICAAVRSMRWPEKLGGAAATGARDPMAAAIAELERAGHGEAAALLRRLPSVPT